MTCQSQCGRARIALLASLALSLLASPSAWSNWLLTRTPFHDVEPGSVGIGYAARFGQSPYEGLDNIGSTYNEYKYDLVPLYLYEGDYLFAHGTEWGVHLLRDHPVFNVDLIGRYRFDRLQVDSSEIFDGMEDRKQTVDGGISASLKGGWGELYLSAVTDLLDRHNGEELELTYLYSWERGKWTLAPSVGFFYQSANLTDYYYGVRPDEATPDRPAYSPGSAYNWRAGLNVTYHWMPSWHLFANLSYEWLDDGIEDSPIVDRSELFAAYFGISWSLGNAKHVETRKEGTKLWSWRVNAGYTVDDTFSQVLVGNFKQHDVVDTYSVGFTLGRLLKDGKRGGRLGPVLDQSPAGERLPGGLQRVRGLRDGHRFRLCALDQPGSVPVRFRAGCLLCGECPRRRDLQAGKSR